MHCQHHERPCQSFSDSSGLSAFFDVSPGCVAIGSCRQAFEAKKLKQSNQASLKLTRATCMESDGPRSQSTEAASSDYSDWEQQQQNGTEPDSSMQEESEAESEEEWQQGRRAQGQRAPRAGGGAAHTPAVATPAAGEGAVEALHAPFSHLLWCNAAVYRTQRRLSNSLCTDIANINSSSGSGTAAVQVTVEVHAASWDVRQYILSQLQQQAAAGGQQQQGQLPAAQDDSSTPGPKVFGPYAATLSNYHTNKHLYITQLQHQHEPQTYLQHLAGKPHCVVLQERVPGSDPPHFKLHLKPGTPDKPGNQDGQAISRAGEGPGLQVAAGSVPEDANPGALGSSSHLYINIPKVLLCSQLPADTTYPLDISLRVLPPPDGQEQGQWTARIRQHGPRSWYVSLGPNHPLSAYAGRVISKLSLSQDKQLTLTFAPAPTAVPAAAHASRRPNPPPQQPQSRRPLKRPAAGSIGHAHAQQQPVAAGQGLGGRRGMSAAAAAAGGTSGQTAAAAATPKKPRRTNQQQQQAATAEATGAVPPLKLSAGQAARAQRAAGRAAEVAAADSSTPPAAAARKKHRLTQRHQQGLAATAAAGPPLALVPIKQEADSSTPPAAVAANTGLLFWHMGEISSNSSSSGDGDEGDSTGGAAQPAAGNLAGAPADQDPSAAFNGAAAVGAASASASSPAASTQHDSVGADTAAAAACASSQQAVWFAGEQQQLGRDREHDSMEGAGEPSPATTPAAAPAAAPAPVAPPALAPEAPAAAAAPAASLPAGLQLLPASTPAEIEAQLVGLMIDSLMPLLDPGEFDNIMQQLSELFASGRQPALDRTRLRCRCAYVRSAVRVGQLGRVVKELAALVRECCI